MPACSFRQNTLLPFERALAKNDGFPTEILKKCGKTQHTLFPDVMTHFEVARWLCGQRQ